MARIIDLTGLSYFKTKLVNLISNPAGVNGGLNSLNFTATTTNLNDDTLPGGMYVYGSNLTASGAPTANSGKLFNCRSTSSSTIMQMALVDATGDIYIRTHNEGTSWNNTWIKVTKDSQFGAANGVATLDANGKLNTAQLPTIPTSMLPSSLNPEVSISVNGTTLVIQGTGE